MAMCEIVPYWLIYIKHGWRGLTVLIISRIMKSFIEYFILLLICYLSLIFSANTADIQNLIFAARNGNLELVRGFVDDGRAEANSRDGEALILAAENGHSEVVRFLVTEGPVETRALANCHDGEALIRAARYGHLEVLWKLVHWLTV